MRPVLISIQPQYADMILAGKKNIELRKQLPPTDRLYIYETAPVKKVVAVCKVHRAVITVSGLLQQPPVGWHIGVNEDFIKEYYAGKDIAECYVIEEVTKVDMTLEDFGMTRPPQSWCYADKAFIEQ